MSKPTLLILVLMAILTASFLIYITNTQKDLYKPGVWPEADRAVSQANHLYNTKKVEGIDFKNGPCLSNDLQPNWVADIVHVPRQTVDDDLQNQCQAYLEGRAKHFVELDLEGNLVRVK